MVNFRIISKILGSLLFIEAFFMAWCVVIAPLREGCREFPESS